MKIYDLVKSIVNLPNIPIGTEGTVVYKYDNETFEVEFFKNNKTISIEIVSINQIEKR